MLCGRHYVIHNLKQPCIIYCDNKLSFVKCRLITPPQVNFCDSYCSNAIAVPVIVWCNNRKYRSGASGGKAEHHHHHHRHHCHHNHHHYHITSSSLSLLWSSTVNCLTIMLRPLLGYDCSYFERNNKVNSLILKIASVTFKWKAFVLFMPSNLTLIEFWAHLTLGGHLIDSFLIVFLDRLVGRVQ